MSSKEQKQQVRLEALKRRAETLPRKSPAKVARVTDQVCSSKHLRTQTNFDESRTFTGLRFMYVGPARQDLIKVVTRGVAVIVEDLTDGGHSRTGR
jgi:hypothetical protein